VKTALALASVTTIVALLCAWFVAGSRSRDVPDLFARIDGSMPAVRVALAVDVPAVRLEVTGPYRIHAGRVGTDGASGQTRYQGRILAPLEATAQGAALDIGGTRFPSGAAWIEAETSGALFVDGRPYRGGLQLYADDGKVTAVSHVPLEPYVAGVLSKEMPLGFPEPALRAQAIAARTYAFYHVRQRAGRGRWDVRSDTRSQVFGGMAAESDKSRRVVGGTYGVVLTYKGKLIQSYFHSTCGGGTIPASWMFNEPGIPPFMGAECTYCADSKYNHWISRVTPEKLGAGLERYGVQRPISSIKVTRLGPKEHVEEVTIEHVGGVARISGKQLRRALGGSVCRSHRFVTELDPTTGELRLNGRGWGHAVGMCQVGARGLARDEGYKAADILRFYYPAADLVRLYAVEDG
jgi:stage II sporulation protein D